MGATPLTIRAVGGVFSPDASSQRSSGYFAKLTNELIGILGDVANLSVSNGGSMAELDRIAALERGSPSDVVIWMADIPNSEEKRLPALSEVWHLNGTYLVQSKNNDGGRYTEEEMLARMRASRAELLLVATRGGAGISGVLLSAAGRGTAPITDIPELARETCTAILAGFPCPPILVPGAITRDSLSYANLELSTATELPVGDHPGAFGAFRKHHRHEGVDLYSTEGQPVVSMESGVVRAVLPFTGPQIGMPWWLDTFCVMVEGISGVINYGEIRPADDIRVGKTVARGQRIGNITRVLRKDKGRPMEMLHLERYVYDTARPIDAWKLEELKPKGLLDPTGILLRAYRYFEDTPGYPDGAKESR